MVFGIVQAARERKATAKVVQKMMVAVLRARLDAEPAQANVAGDRGSELGDFDCTDFLEDDFDTGSCFRDCS